MKILVACEESQVVTSAFRSRGHYAYSCDILDFSGGHPEWHIKGDVTPLLTQGWDMILAFPPCTHLAVSGAKWFEQKRNDGRQQKGIDFFMLFTALLCSKVCIENPIGIMSSIYRKPDQIIHPWMFGHLEEKSTCLWLQGLPKLIETNNVRQEMLLLPRKERDKCHYLGPSVMRSKLRSRTYLGVAQAMADQWG